jgi:hypothetical protein
VEAFLAKIIDIRNTGCDLLVRWCQRASRTSKRSAGKSLRETPIECCIEDRPAMHASNTSRTLCRPAGIRAKQDSQRVIRLPFRRRASRVVEVGLTYGILRGSYKSCTRLVVGEHRFFGVPTSLWSALEVTDT